LAAVEIRNVKKSYGTTSIIHGVSIDIRDGEFVVLVGPSGCGKSTLLRMVAGLEDISGGEVRIGDRVVNDVPAKARDIAMVFQNYALYPHMTVADNMGFSLKTEGSPQGGDRGEGPSRSRDPLASTRCSTAIRASSRAASGSASPWGAPSCGIRRSSCSTNPCRTSTPSCA
jgi:ABC-type sugar transport system ATPase subunit